MNVIVCVCVLHFQQLLSGLTVATIVFFADLYFLLKYDV